MSKLSLQPISNSGLKPVYSAVDSANGDKFENFDGRSFIHVKNGSATDPMTVNVVIQRDTKQDPAYGVLKKEAVSINIPLGEDRMIGPFHQLPFNDGNAEVSVSYVGNDLATATIAAVQLPSVK